MMIFRARNLYSSHPFSTSKSFLTSSVVPPHLVKTFHGSIIPQFQGCKNNFLFRRTYMSASSALLEEEVKGKSIGLLREVEDQYGGVIINMDDPMDSFLFASMLESSIPQWKTQGKKGVWIKLPREHSNLVASAIEAGFKYHHAEPDYLMLVYWIPNTPDTLPANASHRDSVGAFVVNTYMEILVVQEKNGRFSGKGIWKLPTGAVNEGEDICAAAIREVKEETGWMAIEDYAAQPFVRENEQFDFLTKIGLSKLDGKYTGFSTLLTSTSSCNKSYVYINKNDSAHLLTSKLHQP